MDGSAEASGPLERAFAALGRALVRWPGLVVGLLVLSLAPAGALATGLEVRASFLDLLPEHERPVQQLRAVLSHARATSDVAIAISREDPELAERFARSLWDALRQAPGVTAVPGRVDLDWYAERRLLLASEADLEAMVQRAEEEIDRATLVEAGLWIDLSEPAADAGAGAAAGPSAAAPEGGLLADLDRPPSGIPEWTTTTDGRYLCLWAQFTGLSGDLESGRRAWDEVRAVVERVAREGSFPASLEIRYAGGIPTRVEDERALSEDLRIAGSAGFVAVVLLIVLALRAPRGLVLLSVPLLVGLVWTFAFARLAVGHLNIISGFLFSILSGLGIEYGIHLLHRYRELREEGLAVEPAIELLLRRTGRALVSGSMTNAGVFAVIAAAQFSGFGEFGTIAAVGLLLTLVATLLGLPSLVVLGERLRPLAPKPALPAASAPLRVPAPLRWLVVLGVPLFAVASAVAVARGEVRFDGSWRVLTGESEPSRFAEYLRHHLGGLFTAGLLWVPRDEDLPRAIAAIDGVRRDHEARGLGFEVVHVATVDDALPPRAVQERRAELARALGVQLRRIHRDRLDADGQRGLDTGLRLVAAARPVAPSEVPESVVGPFLTNDGRGSIAHVQIHETDDADTGVLVAWAEEAREIDAALAREGIEAPLLSENWVAGEIFERIGRDARFLLLGTLAAVFLVLLLDLRRPLLALGMLGSVVLGIVTMAGGMWLTRLTLNFMNAAILPVCVGISVDNAIHVYHRWKEGGPGSIPRVLRHTTAANALASGTNLLGFAALALARNEGLRSVAYLAMIGVTATYVSTTVWFPMVLETLDARRARR